MLVKFPNRFKMRVLAATLFAAALLAACQSKQVQKPPVPVKVATVELHVANSGARYSATIIPRTQVELAFKVDGYVETLQKVRGVGGQVRDIQEGDPIVAGAVLASVRQSDYQVKVREAESQASEARSAIDASKAQYQEALSAIESTKAQLADAEAALEKAKLDFDRAQNLFASQSLTKANYDAAKAQLEQATAKVGAARSQLRMNQARADSANSQIEVVKARSTGAEAVVHEKTIPLQDTALKAPLNGFVLQKSVERGTLVSPGKTGFVVADTSSVKAAFGVADIAVPEMKLGSKLSVETETLPGIEFDGQITSVFPAADPKSRVFNVEVTIPNPKALLRPGMIVSLRVGRSEAAQAQPVVPLNAIVKSTTDANGYAVFVVIEHGGRLIAKVREVKLGETYGNTIAVTEGVKESDRVITTGVTLVRDGDVVKVIP
jgi:multidrug efflux system membrane fusion protein